jgi:hypothetical protein
MLNVRNILFFNLLWNCLHANDAGKQQGVPKGKRARALQTNQPHCTMAQEGPVIYLDYNATTPIDRDVQQAMLPFLSEHFGNAGLYKYCE